MVCSHAHHSISHTCLPPPSSAPPPTASWAMHTGSVGAKTHCRAWPGRGHLSRVLPLFHSWQSEAGDGDCHRHRLDA
jgi:hypothetical protein